MGHKEVIAFPIRAAGRGDSAGPSPKAGEPRPKAGKGEQNLPAWRGKSRPPLHEASSSSTDMSWRGAHYSMPSRSKSKGDSAGPSPKAEDPELEERQGQRLPPPPPPGPPPRSPAEESFPDWGNASVDSAIPKVPLLPSDYANKTPGATLESPIPGTPAGTETMPPMEGASEGAGSNPDAPDRDPTLEANWILPEGPSRTVSHR